MKGLEEHLRPEECVSSLSSCGGLEWVFAKGLNISKNTTGIFAAHFHQAANQGLVLTKDQNCDKNHWIGLYTKNILTA